MASALASALATEVASSAAKGAGKAYSSLDEKTKTGLWSGVAGLGFAHNAIVSLPIAILATVLNVIVLNVIFTLTMYRKYSAQNRDKPFYKALTRGMGLATVAGVLLFGASILTGGLASLAMLAVYPLAGLATGLGSLVDIEALHDIKATQDKDGYISGFARWSVSFWPIFIIAMIASILITLGVGAAGTVALKKLTDVTTSAL